MLKKKVVFVEYAPYPRSVPLTSYYLQAFSKKDSTIVNNYEFVTIAQPILGNYLEKLKTLQKENGDIYAFSCYVWNMGVIKKLLKDLANSLPKALFVLGGPQVSESGSRYISLGLDQIIICNGMGEMVFYRLLLEMTNSMKTLSKINGLTYFERTKEGTLLSLTTNPQPPLIDLDQIPSPFLEGYIEKEKYIYTVFETNRGCPYTCAFCYWAGHQGKLGKFSEERIKSEIEWICQNGFYAVMIADANWGILERDVMFSEFFGQCKKKYGFPYFVHFSSTKKDVDRRISISKMIHQYGMASAQSLSIQTISEQSLHLIQRRNLGIETIREIQNTLNKEGVTTYIELVFPLPGETMESFNKGIDTLCSLGAESFSIYPALVLNSTTFDRKRTEFGLQTVFSADENSEAEYIVATNEISNQQYIQGLWIIFAVYTLYNSRNLYCLLHFLYKEKGILFSDIFSKFGDYCRRKKPKAALLYQDALDKFTYFKFSTLGTIAHYILGKERDAFNYLLFQFLFEHELINEQDSRFMFEIDLFNKPYLYTNDKISLPELEFKYVKPINVNKNCITLEINPQFDELLSNYVEKHETIINKSSKKTVVHLQKHKMPLMKKSDDDLGDYCQGLLEHVRDIVPEWKNSA